MQDLVEDLRRGAQSIDRCNAFRRVILKHPGCVSLVDCQPMVDDVLLSIIRTAFLGSALAQPLNHLFDITADQVKNLDDRDMRIQQGRLPDRSRDAIKDE